MMKKMTYTTILAATCGLFALSQTSCEKGSTPDEPTKPSSAETTDAKAAVNPAIDAVFLDEAPEGAVTVLESRKKPEPGTTITVSGRVAGARAPFSKDYASLVLADDSLMTCERNPEDSCEAPWDACCVAPATIAASRITVQIVGEDGRPVGQTLKQVHGLKELDGLTVTGTVAEGSNQDNLILNATGIFQKKS